MKILVEGADVSGKGTLIEALMKELGSGWRHVHHTQNTNSPAEFLVTANSSDNLIIDRLWMSEQIYGYVMRGESNDPELIVLNRMMKTPHILVMCVRTDVKKHLDHFNEMIKKREEYVQESEKMEKIIKAFRDVTFGEILSTFPGVIGNLSKTCPMVWRRNCVVHDMDVDTIESTINKIKSLL